MSSTYDSGLLTFNAFWKSPYPASVSTVGGWFRRASETRRIRADWLAPVGKSLKRLERLPHNWDSYGAVPARPEHAETALAFLADVLREGDVLPEVVPLADGGIHLEWRLRDLEVDFIADEGESAVLLIQQAGESFHEYRSLDDARRAFAEGVAGRLRGNVPSV